jgi:hypothetical protein
MAFAVIRFKDSYVSESLSIVETSKIRHFKKHNFKNKLFNVRHDDGLYYSAQVYESSGEDLRYLR